MRKVTMTGLMGCIALVSGCTADSETTNEIVSFLINAALSLLVGSFTGGGGCG